MRKLLQACLIAFLTIALFQGNASASASSDWASKCSQFGAIKQNQNPSFQQFNCLLTNAAINANVPPEVVKAVAWQENGWKQFNADGTPSVSDDGGIGAMQITNQAGYDKEELKTNILYNIKSGVEILSNKYDHGNLPMIKGADRRVIENWYFPVMAYNGIKPVNSPLEKSTGKPNPVAYQEKVFRYIEENSFLGDAKLAKFPFKNTDFQYDPDKDENIVFKNLEYIVSGRLHTSNYFFNKGDKVLVTNDTVVRPNRSKDSLPVVKNVAKNTVVTINGSFNYDLSVNKQNQYVWYPVITADHKLGYISTAYISALPSCWQYLKSGKVIWNNVELKPGQIGRLTVLQNTQLIKPDGTTVRILKKGQVYPIYAFKGDSLSVGGGLYVKRDITKVKYETPSKTKLDLVKCVTNYK